MKKLDFTNLGSGSAYKDPFLMTLQTRVDTFNGREGKDNTGIDCPFCKNRGEIAYIGETGSFTVRPCKCFGARRTVERLQSQGLYERAQRSTLDTYRTDTDVRKAIKGTVTGFLKEPAPHWLALCGQSGVGKTHVCTAAFVQLSFLRGLNGRYFLWNSDGRKLKASALNGDDSPINSVKKCELLYIDDLFKSKRGTDPSDADVRLAFEILDYRYNSKLTTIISSEMTLEDIRDLDFALYRRISEMCGPYKVNISYGTDKCFVPED